MFPLRMMVCIQNSAEDNIVDMCDWRMVSKSKRWVGRIYIYTADCMVLCVTKLNHKLSQHNHKDPANKHNKQQLISQNKNLSHN